MSLNDTISLSLPKSAYMMRIAVSSEVLFKLMPFKGHVHTTTNLLIFVPFDVLDQLNSLALLHHT